MPAVAYTVVIPAYQAADTLGDCLAALSVARPAPSRVIVFDDGSRDGTGDIAQAYGATVIRNDGPNLGPAHGRNVGVAAAETDIVVFVDADVAVAPDAPHRLASAIASNRRTVAAFGAYGDRVSARVANLAGRYANLRHHAVHAQAGGASGEAEASTFWSGLGAVDRAAFLAVGGFDEDYGQPSIEDVELGLRLRAKGGRVRLVANARGDHMKDWTLRQLWRTDILQRAVPWSRLAAEGRIASTLNTGAGEQAKSVLAHLVWFLAFCSAVLAFWSEGAALAAIAGSGVALVAYCAANRRFFALLGRHSASTAVGGAALHWLYHCYASVTFTLVTARTGFAARMRRRGERRAPKAAPLPRAG